MNPHRNIRWFFLALGLVAVIGLTGMNVYSLYALHDNAVKNSVDNQKRQLFEFTNQVRNRIRQPVRHFRRLDMEKLKKSLAQSGSISGEISEKMTEYGPDHMFSGIYLAAPECKACDVYGAPLWQFSHHTGQFDITTEYSPKVSDGLTMARTRMKTLVSDYRWTTRIIFDTHNSMAVALINPAEREIVGYLIFLIDRDFLVTQYLEPKLRETFGTGPESGIVIWLHDWTKNEVLAVTHPDIAYSYQIVDFIQNFPDLLNDWNLKARFTKNPDISASRASLVRNLLVLAGAVILLIGALIFMFLTAQRERSLAQRQALFLANVTHELKTPLSVILAAGENLQDGRITDTSRLKSYGSHIYQESVRLHSMIDRLLDVARTGTKSLTHRKKTIDPAGYIRDYMQKKERFLKAGGFVTELSIEQELPEISVDPQDLTSIFDNLIDNAVKYSPFEKHLSIKARQHRDNVVIEFHDRGIGVPRDALKHLFDKFFRVEDPRTSDSRGHGLGLAIVKDLVTKNNGAIRVSSTPDSGSVFIVYFPGVPTSSPSSGSITTEQETVAAETAPNETNRHVL